MKSAADALRREEREHVLALAAAERVALALSLGARGLEAFRRSAGLSREEAVRELERRRPAGRRRWACVEATIECPPSAT